MVTKNFEIGELFAHCSTAEIDSAVRDARIMNNLQTLLCVLQCIRFRLGRPIVVNSGYRDKEHNRNVGGVATSQHLTGEACDFYVIGMGIPEVTRILYAEFDYCIGQLIQYNSFIHIALQNTKHPRLEYIDKTKK